MQICSHVEGRQRQRIGSVVAGGVGIRVEYRLVEIEQGGMLTLEFVEQHAEQFEDFEDSGRSLIGDLLC